MSADAQDLTILLVDDDVQLREMLAAHLRAHGFAVKEAGEGRQMFSILRASAIDLIVLDVMLPGRSGLELCQQVRRDSRIPILILTSRNEETDRVLGLELGADDYLTKPFSSRELVARVRAVLRRTTAPAAEEGSDTIYEFEGWRLNTVRRELVNAENVIVDLTSGEYELLLAFVQAAQRVLSRDQLLELAHNRSVVQGFDRSVDVQISRLRRKLEGADTDKFIKTVRGAGYMFIPSVKRS